MALFRRMLLLGTLLSCGLGAVGSGCRSTDHSEQQAASVAGSSALTEAEATPGGSELVPEKAVVPAEGGHAKSDAPAARTTPGAPPSVSKFDCKQQPDGLCCEALTPVCNDCREKHRRQLADWQSACAKSAPPGAAPAPSIDCGGVPPVSECCADATAECRDCRALALTKMLAWKEACSDLEAWPCDRKPVFSECCDALMPSCSQCRDRNLRLAAAWAKRCEQK